MSMHPHATSPSRPRRLSAQRGTSVMGLLGLAIVVGFVALMLIRVYPSVTEFLTVRRAVAKIMKDNPATPADVRTAFEKQKEVEYNITTVDAKDLDIQQNGDRMTTKFHYSVKVPIIDPVSLLIEYSGGASTGGGAP